MSLDQTMEDARLLLAFDHPFFSALFAGSKVQLVDDLEAVIGMPAPACCTTRNRLMFCRKRLATATAPAVMFVTGHEALHAALHHTQSHVADARPDARLRNMAMDFVINDMLIDCGLKMPEGELRGLHRPGKEDRLKSWIEVYDELEQSGEGGKGGGAGDKFIDLVSDPDGDPSPAERDQIEMEAKVTLATAAKLAQDVGKVPASLKRMVDEALNPKLPWWAILEPFMTGLMKQEVSWSRPHRRYLWQGIYLPSAIDEPRLSHVGLVIDTSGSIGAAELGLYQTQINRIFETCRPAKVTVVYADARVNHVDTFEDDDFPVQLSPHGGGGTDFRPAVRWFEAEGEPPEVVVYLTDGYGNFPERAPSFPMVWCITTNVVAPHGVTIHTDLKGA
jgi:predicted metal-dependent peptidase